MSRFAQGSKPPMDGSVRSVYRLAPRLMMIASTCLVLSTPSFASPIRYDFSGVITTAPASTGVAAGTPFSGSFWYNPSQGTALGFEGFTEYSSRGTSSDAAGMSLSIGDASKLLGPNNFFMTMEYTPAYGPSDPTPPSSEARIGDSDPSSSLTLILSNPTANLMAKSTLGVPGTLSLSDFTTTQLDYIQKSAGGNVEYQGVITSMTAVPEPTCATVVCLAAGWLARLWHARKARIHSAASEA